MNSYRVVAENFAEESENRIHSDEIARKYGFTGALVPGVTVYGYLTHPLVERFGEQWLGGSVSSVRFLKPAYHGDPLTISMEDHESGWLVSCHNERGELLAELTSTLPETLPEPADQQVFDAPAKTLERVEMNWQTVQEGRPFAPWHWQITEDANRIYTEQVCDELPVYRLAAHPHWLLGVANRVLTREYIMPAWIHVGSEVTFRELLKAGDTVEVRAVPLSKWERKGHQFVRLYVAYYRDSELTTEIFHTAIFRVAEK